MGQVDLAHAAGAEQLDDAVVIAEPIAGRERVGSVVRPSRSTAITGLGSVTSVVLRTATASIDRHAPRGMLGACRYLVVREPGHVRFVVEVGARSRSAATPTTRS